MKLFRLLLLLVLSLAVTSCIPAPLPPVDGGSIEINGHELYWDTEDFPIWILVDDQLPSEHIAATLEAADAWNTEVGSQVFEAVVYDHSRPAPQTSGFVAVSMRDLGQSVRDTRILGLARASVHRGSTHMMASQVWFDEDLLGELLLVVMVHELGHALTLEHDNDCTSIMHPYVVMCEGTVGILPNDVARIQSQMDGSAHAGHVHAQDIDFLPEVWRRLCTL